MLEIYLQEENMLIMKKTMHFYERLFAIFICTILIAYEYTSSDAKLQIYNDAVSRSAEIIKKELRDNNVSLCDTTSFALYSSLQSKTPEIKSIHITNGDGFIQCSTTPNLIFTRIKNKIEEKETDSVLLDLSGDKGRVLVEYLKASLENPIKNYSASTLFLIDGFKYSQDAGKLKIQPYFNKIRLVVYVVVMVLISYLMSLAMFKLARRLVNSKLVNKAKLDKLIRDNKIALYFQPIVSVKTRSFFGVESLLRVRSPDGKGYVNTSEFIGWINKTKLNVELTLHCICLLEKCLLVLNGEAGLVVTINVNLNDLKNKEVISALYRCKEICPDNLNIGLEITEYEYTEVETALLENIDALKIAGFLIVLDDYGSRLNNIDRLRSIPFDVVKLDKEIANDPMYSEVFSRSIIEYAAINGIDVIIEGVESIDQLVRQVRFGACIFQGYIFEKAMPVHLLVKHLNVNPFEEVTY